MGKVCGIGLNNPPHKFVSFMLAIACLPSVAGAAEICPWLNAATAGGVLGGDVTDLIVKRAKSGDDANCSFARHDGSLTVELHIEVETMPSPARDFASYKARCDSAAVPLKVIGNEAVACSNDGSDDHAELVVGRVRDRAFVVRIGTSDHTTQPSALRDNARKIAEQVAGILF
jgi:hypothetical protein